MTRLLVGLLGLQFVFMFGLAYYLMVVIPNQTKLPPLNVLRLVNPQMVLNKRVRADELLRVTATKCNLTDEPVAVEGVAYLVRENPTYRRYLREQNFGVTRLPGCVTINYQNDLRLGLAVDVTLEAGVYHLEGAETVRQGDRTQTAPWYTESFEIVEAK